MTKKATIATALFLLSGLSAWAQSPSQPPLTAEQIFEKNIEALGGRTALEHVTSWVKRGSRTGVALVASGPLPEGVRTSIKGGTVENYWKAPRQSLMTLNAGTKDEVKAGSNGKVMWTSVEGGLTIGPPAGGPGSPTGVVKNYLDFITSGRREARVKLKGIKKVEGRPAYKIELTWADGRRATDYYDADSFLLVRSEMVIPARQYGAFTASVEASESLSDYREVDGVKFAFETKSGLGAVTHFTEIQVNPELDDSIFQPPAVKKK